MISVEAKGLSKRFAGIQGRELQALDRLDLNVGSGEYLVVVGPSGGGKTTLLRLMAGLETPDEGTVTLWEDGKKVEMAAGNSDSHINVAMVFQDSALYPHLTVRGNLELGLKVRRLEVREMNHRIEEVSAACGIDKDWWPKKPSELSGGERKRVALARALVRQPRLLLLDEPLSNLDIPARSSLRAVLRRLPGRDAMTVIHVTHDQFEALSLGQRIAVLNHGRLQQLGAPRDVYERPANVFVASFLGSSPINLISGNIAASNAGVPCFSVKSGSHEFRLDLPAVSRGSGGYPGKPGSVDRVILGVRPEWISKLEAGTSGKEALSGRVVSIDYLGADSLVCVETSGIRIFARWQNRLDKAEVGDIVNFQIDRDAVSWFSAETGERLNLETAVENHEDLRKLVKLPA